MRMVLTRIQYGSDCVKDMVTQLLGVSPSQACLLTRTLVFRFSFGSVQSVFDIVSPVETFRRLKREHDFPVKNVC